MTHNQILYVGKAPTPRPVLDTIKVVPEFGAPSRYVD